MKLKIFKNSKNYGFYNITSMNNFEFFVFNKFVSRFTIHATGLWLEKHLEYRRLTYRKSIYNYNQKIIFVFL
jgi:hypothetical protein